MKRSMWSVTTEDVPAQMDLKRSPFGTAQKRWSHGLYRGVKLVPMSYPGGSWRSRPFSSRRRTSCG